MRSIYLSSMMERYKEMENISFVLNHHGHQITSRWHSEEWIHLCEESKLFNSTAAYVDLSDIHCADTMIIFTEQPGTIGPMYGGRHVEFGIAIERKMKIIRVGPVENLFYHLNVFEEVFPTAKELLKWICV